MHRLKKFIREKKNTAFCNQLKLSYDEYKQICVKRRHQLMKEKMSPRLAAKQMYFQSLHTTASSTTPGKSLPCLVFLTGLKPTDLFKNENDLLNPMMKKKLNICRIRWPCEDLSLIQIHDKYQGLWRYHLSRMFPRITLSNLPGVVEQAMVCKDSKYICLAASRGLIFSSIN